MFEKGLAGTGNTAPEDGRARQNQPDRAGYPSFSGALRQTVRDPFEARRDLWNFADLDDVRTSFLTGGVITLIRDWLSGDLSLEADELGERIATLVTVNAPAPL